jgi:hypothetical protein
VAFAFLVLLACEGMEGAAAKVLVQAGIVIQVEDEIACQGGCALCRAHASDSEGDSRGLVAEVEEILWGGAAGAEEGQDHVPQARDALFVGVRTAQDVGQTPDQARVGQGAVNRGWEVGVPMACDDGVNDAF